jgi:hypothetical protein
MTKSNRKHFRFLPIQYIPGTNKTTEESKCRYGQRDSLSGQRSSFCSEQKQEALARRKSSASATQNPIVTDFTQMKRSSSTAQDPIATDFTHMQHHQMAKRRTSHASRRTKEDQRLMQSTNKQSTETTGKQSTEKKKGHRRISTVQNDKNLRKETLRVPTIMKHCNPNIKYKIYCENMSKTNENTTIPPGSENLLSQQVDDDGRAEKNDASSAAVAPHNFFIVKPAHILFQRSDLVTVPPTLDNAAGNFVEEDIFLEDPNCKCIIPNLMLL